MNMVFTSDFSGIGGGETSLINLAVCLSREHHVTVICAREGNLVERLKEKGISVYVLHYMEKKKVLTNLIYIRKILKKEKADIIHSNGHLTSILFYMASIGLGACNYWTCHGQWYKFNRLSALALRFCNRKIFCVTKAVEDNLHRMFIYNTLVSHLGIPVNLYHYALPLRFRNALGIPDQCFLIAIIGRYQEIKGQLKGVMAIEKLLENGCNVYCILVGGNVFQSNADQEYENMVKDYIKFHNLDKRILILGERQDIPQIYKSIDLLLIPSDNESFGMVAAEALAAETPIISTPNDGVSEILYGSSYMLSETNDVDGLYKAVKKYLDDPDVREAVRVYLHDNWSNFDIENVSKKYKNVFEGNI